MTTSLNYVVFTLCFVSYTLKEKMYMCGKSFTNNYVSSEIRYYLFSFQDWHKLLPATAAVKWSDGRKNIFKAMHVN